MPFIEENKNFFEHFYSELRNLDLDSKQEKYESFKDQIKDRTSAYYQKIEIADKAQTLLQKDRFFKDLIDSIGHYDADEAQTLLQKDHFYKDLIDCIGLYDFDYILMNLFLDKDFIKLIPSFNTNEKFKSLLEQSKTTLALFIKGFIKKINASLSVEKEFSTYLKNAFYDFIQSDNQTWDSIKFKKDSSINHRYSQYLIKSITYDPPHWQSIIFNHLLFIKAYNHLAYFSTDTSAKNILFLNNIIAHYKIEKTQHDVKLAELIFKIDWEIHNNCFVNYLKSPISMSETTAQEISTGLAKKVRDFLDILNIHNAIADTNSLAYYNLFKLSERFSLEDFEQYINEKLEKDHVIEKEVITKIEEDSNSNLKKSKDLIYKKIYLFDYLHFTNHNTLY